MTLRKFENFDENFFFNAFFFVLVNFLDNFFLNVILLSPFVRIAKMLQGFVNQNIYFWTIISFVCALISKHNVSLRHKIIIYYKI